MLGYDDFFQSYHMLTLGLIFSVCERIMLFPRSHVLECPSPWRWQALWEGILRTGWETQTPRTVRTRNRDLGVRWRGVGTHPNGGALSFPAFQHWLHSTTSSILPCGLYETSVRRNNILKYELFSVVLIKAQLTIFFTPWWVQKHFLIECFFYQWSIICANCTVGFLHRGNNNNSLWFSDPVWLIKHF